MRSLPSIFNLFWAPEFSVTAALVASEHDKQTAFFLLKRTRGLISVTQV